MTNAHPHADLFFCRKILLFALRISAACNAARKQKRQRNKCACNFHSFSMFFVCLCMYNTKQQIFIQVEMVDNPPPPSSKAPLHACTYRERTQARKHNTYARHPRLEPAMLLGKGNAHVMLLTQLLCMWTHNDDTRRNKTHRVLWNGPQTHTHTRAAMHSACVCYIIYPTTAVPVVQTKIPQPPNATQPPPNPTARSNRAPIHHCVVVLCVDMRVYYCVWWLFVKRVWFVRKTSTEKSVGQINGQQLNVQISIHHFKNSLLKDKWLC